jgi:RNA polymerase sigma-32 factor
MNYPVVASRFDQFLSEVRKIKPLPAEREFDLAVRYRETGDRDAAHELVVSHLPFVVKMAYQHRHYMLPMQDLVQEGTVGLMKALQRFDPYRGYRLVSFAVFWIKAHIKNFVIRSWNLVKLGTTQAQRRLFSHVGRIGEHPDEESKSRRVKDLAEELGVKEDDVIEMEARMKARDWSLDQTIGEESPVAAVELLADQSPNQESLLIEKERESALGGMASKALAVLDPRERFIITKRFIEETPWTLQKLGDHFGTTRERMRQLEGRALNKMRKALTGQSAEALLPA